jgi:hypothetical protein
MDYEYPFPHSGASESNTSFKTFGVGLAAGAAIGVALGLLLAPTRAAAPRRDLAVDGDGAAVQTGNATADALREARRHAPTPTDEGAVHVQGPLIEKQS